MDEENASCAHDADDEKNAHVSLVDLPLEIFLHVCSFLDASTIVHSLSLVCKQFHLNLKDDLLWKKRFNRICPDASHPLLRPARPDKLFWMLSCVAIEKQIALWQRENSMQKVTIEKPCNGSSQGVTSVLLRHIDDITYIVSATSRTLRCHKLSSREELLSYELKTSCNENFSRTSSKCLTAMDHTIYGCVSYNKVKSWVLMNTGLVHQGTYEIERCNDVTNVSMQCIASCPENALFATGGISHCMNFTTRDTIYVFDPRASNKSIMHYNQPDIWPPPVWNLAMDTEYIVSSMKDNTVCVWDQRAGRIMKSIKVMSHNHPVCSLSDTGCITSISMERDWVCVVDNEVKLHMLNPKNNFKLVKSYSTEHKGWITGVHLTHGCLITSSLDGTVRISSPTDPPKPIVTLRTDFESICSMDYLNDILAITDYDSHVAVLRPK